MATSDAPIKYDDEEEELLFGLTDRPDDLMSVAAAGAKYAPRPGNLERFLPIISQAAMEADAPDEVRRFARILAYHLGREV